MTESPSSNDERASWFEVPRILYKYCSPDRLSFFEDLNVKYTPPSDFNDIHDSVAVKEFINEINTIGSEVYFVTVDHKTGLPLYDEQHFESFLKNSAKQNPGYKLLSVAWIDPFQNEEDRGAFLAGYRSISSDRNSMLISCFSSDSTINQMWAYYAVDHAGFCLGFRADASIFTERVGRTNLDRVIYSNSPPKGPPEAISRRRYLVKETGWSHEREWRSLIHRSRVPPTRLKSGKDIFLRKALPEDLVRVILGCRASPELETNIRSRMPTHTELYRCVTSEGSYSLQIIQI